MVNTVDLTGEVDGGSAPSLSKAQQEANTAAYAQQLTCKFNDESNTFTLQRNNGQVIGVGSNFENRGNGIFLGDVRVKPTVEHEIRNGRRIDTVVDDGPMLKENGFKVDLKNNMCDMTMPNGPKQGEHIKAGIDLFPGSVYTPVTPDMLKR